MSQATLTTPGSPLTMAALKVFLDAGLDALLTVHRGDPADITSPTEGMLCWDNTVAPDVLKRYTETAGWISILSINVTTGAITSSVFAASGANADITSMTGLDDDGIPVAKIANGDIATDHIWAAAGDLVVGTGNDTAGVLSKGLANYKLFMNSGGATPEWGKGSHAGLFTRDISVASGDQAVTGLGFKPSAILFVAAIVDAPQSCNAIWSSSGSMGSVYSPSFGTATTGFYGTGDTLALIIDSSNNCTAIMKSADSDGFTLTWTKVGSPTGTMQIYYLAFR